MTDDTLDACPACDSARIRINATKREKARAPTYRCKDCNATFDDPTTRERQGGARLSGLAKALAEADPDAVGGGR
jgi:transposase-like protein